MTNKQMRKEVWFIFSSSCWPSSVIVSAEGRVEHQKFDQAAAQFLLLNSMLDFGKRSCPSNEGPCTYDSFARL